MPDSTDKTSGSIISKRKQDAINTTKSMNKKNGPFQINNTAKQEEFQAKQRNRNSGYIIPRLITG